MLRTVGEEEAELQFGDAILAHHISHTAKYHAALHLMEPSGNTNEQNLGAKYEK